MIYWYSLLLLFGGEDAGISS